MQYVLRAIAKSISNVNLSRISRHISVTGVNFAKPASSVMPVVLSRDYYVLPNETPFCYLNCEEAFKNLSAKERRYAHYLSLASWYGSLIVFHQTSPESPLIFVLLHKIFRQEELDDLKTNAAKNAGLTDEEFKAFLVYAAGIYYNHGNYKGFGDTKIVPDLDRSKFEAFVRHTAAYKAEKSIIDEILGATMEKVYGLSEREKTLGLGKAGVTTYHSSNVEKEDTDLIVRFMKANNLEAWNTRLFKTVKDGKTCYEIRVASVEKGVVSEPVEFEGCLVTVTRGDYGPLLARAVHYLELAKKNAANPNQESMLSKYCEHFTTGRMELHKDGSRFWIKDKAPAVESYIGFIENYRDPVGVRSEFEGFVAVVNRAMTEKFTKLVETAEALIKRLPWDNAYNTDKFLQPDFTSLDVLTFGASGIPSGINIPNYDEIRQNDGFKNVSLGNVISAVPNVKINFLTQEDQDIFRRYHGASFEVQVGLHELLGHGSGKLFQRSKDGKYNFDVESVKDMETGEKITSWYEDGETWSSKFGSLSSSYEECRAEAVGYFLSTFPDVLEIFGYTGQEADDVKYANWMLEIRAGLLGLEYYSPEKSLWTQAHCHARFVLLMVVMEAGEDFVRIKEFTNGEDNKEDLLFTLDRTKIDSVGKVAVFEFLKKLQLYKSTGNFEKGKALFDKYAEVTPKISNWRDIVIERRQPRKILVLPNTSLTENDEVLLKGYPGTVEGAIESNIDCYAEPKVEDEMYQLWKEDACHFN